MISFLSFLKKYFILFLFYFVLLGFLLILLHGYFWNDAKQV
jgi:hypothetical protein